MEKNTISETLAISTLVTILLWLDIVRSDKTNTLLMNRYQGRCGGKGGLTPGSLTPQSPHFGAVPRFLMCRSRSLPPGVLITRTLFEVVL